MSADNNNTEIPEPVSASDPTKALSEDAPGEGTKEEQK
jgi:hypothetical protein